MNAAYRCSSCNGEIKKGDFIAVLGAAPASGLSAPIARADKLFEDLGLTYCARCFQSLGAEELIARFRQAKDG